jgi:hypothetical protein
MKRGVVTLTKETNSILRSLIEADPSSSLASKLSSLTAQTMYVQLNQEEVEQIMDLLPPSDQAKQAETQLRFELSKILSTT